MELNKTFSFEAAHQLPRVPAGHKCSRMHGHSYRVEVGLMGPVDPITGWLVDFAALDDVWRPIFRTLDHQTLNDVAGLENPTCENLCGFIWNALAGKLSHLSRITVWETPDSCCTFRGDAG